MPASDFKRGLGGSTCGHRLGHGSRVGTWVGAADFKGMRASAGFLPGFPLAHNSYADYIGTHFRGLTQLYTCVAQFTGNQYRIVSGRQGKTGLRLSGHPLQTGQRNHQSLPGMSVSWHCRPLPFT